MLKYIRKSLAAVLAVMMLTSAFGAAVFADEDTEAVIEAQTQSDAANTEENTTEAADATAAPADEDTNNELDEVTEDIVDDTVTEEKRVSLPDIVGTKYENAVDLLVGLGIVTGDDDGNFYPDREVTRAEATAMVLRLIGMPSADTANGASQIYLDVPVGQWYTSYINTATKVGFIAGDGDGYFRPEDPVTYDEYIKMIISGIGYDEIAKSKGGYPSGYVQLANEIGVLDNETFMSGTNITRGATAMYAYNAMFTRVLTTVYGQNGALEYYMSDNNAYLIESIFNVYEVRGKVISNSFTSINETGAENDEGRITIQTEDGGLYIYGTGYTNAADYLGFAVVAYVKDSSGVSDIISIGLEADMNNMVELSGSDITTIETSDASVTVRYDAENTGDERTLRVPTSATVIYNGRYDNTLETKSADYYNYILAPERGTVIYLDNNGDSRIDLVYVTTYVNYIADRVNADDDRIVLKTAAGSAATLELKPDATEYRFNIIKDGAQIELGEIEVDDIVSVSESLGSDDKHYVLYVSDFRVEGEIATVIQGTYSAASEDEYMQYGTAVGNTSTEVTVDGTGYLIDNGVSAPDPGDVITLYINAFGKVAYTDEIQSGSDKYMFLTDITSEGVFQGEVKIRVVTEDGALAAYTLNDKVNVYYRGEDSQWSATQLKESIDAWNNSGVYSEQVRYKLIQATVNSEGLISSINFPLITNNSAGEYNNEDEFSLDYSSVSSLTDLDTSNGPTIYFSNGTPARIGSMYALADDCKFFSVAVESGTGIVDPERVRVISSYSSVNTSNDIICDIYDADRNMTADAVVYFYSVGGTAPERVEDTDSLFLFDHYAQEINDEGYKEYKLYGYKDGEYVAISMEDEITPNLETGISSTTDTPQSLALSLKQGDVLQFKLNSDNRMDKYRLVYTIEDGITYSVAVASGSNYSSVNLELNEFRIESIGSNVIVFDDVRNNAYRTLAINDSIPVYLVNLDRNGEADAIELGDITDIEEDEVVFTRFYRDAISEIIVYRENY